jgi:hypothetical protein
MAKSKIFWYYYFFIALPVFGFMFFFWEPSTNEEQFSEIYKDIDKQISNLRDGQYDLYGISDGEKIGKVNLRIDREHDRLELSIDGKKTSGTYLFDDWGYTFKRITEKNLVLQPMIIKNQVIWLKEKEDSAYVLALVKKDWYDFFENKPDGLYYLFSHLPIDQIRYLKGTDVNIPTNEILSNSAYETLYSGIMFIPLPEKK